MRDHRAWGDTEGLWRLREQERSHPLKGLCQGIFFPLQGERLFFRVVVSVMSSLHQSPIRIKTVKLKLMLQGPCLLLQTQKIFGSILCPITK